MGRIVLPHEMWVKKHYARERVVILPDGRRARVHVDDSGTVRHTETDETLDVEVQPLRTITVKVDKDEARPLVERLRAEGHRL